MNEILKEYYGINITYYKECDNGIIFNINGYNYYLVESKYDKDKLTELLNIYEYIKYKVKLHEFVLNKNNEILSDKYVLLKVNHLITDIDYYDLNKFLNINVDSLSTYYINFYELWENKIDYLEFQISELSDKKIINNSFDYFVGIAELLIKFYKNNYSSSKSLYIGHNNCLLNTLEYYNPLNLVIDSKYRDLAWYIRCNKKYDLLSNMLDKIDYEEKIYLFVRLCFPFEYFDLVSRVLVDKEDEKDLVLFIDEIDDYEERLSELEKIFGIYLFYWIKKE